MMMTKKIIALFALCVAFSMCMHAQVAVKTNVIDDALLDVNIGAEARLRPKWSAEVIGSINTWSSSNGKSWKHWYAQPGVRYWLCDVWDGHFFGAHIHGGQYNVGGIKHLSKFLGTDFSKLSDNRYQGWFVGAGLSYGYSWILNRHWNIEAELGIGWSYTRYDQFPCTQCGKRKASDRTHNYVGPTKAAVGILYIF